MLDDFKSVLQRLGALKLDGSQQAMMPNSLNITANEKAGDIDDDADEKVEHVNGSTRSGGHQSRMSMSGRMLDDGEELDDEGRSRRRQSMSGSAVGKLGIKARKLGGLGFMRKSAEREAQLNMERNKRVSSGEKVSEEQRRSVDARLSVEPRRSNEPDLAREPTEAQDDMSFDFITSALDDSGPSK
jgi:hypothetical protein